MKGRKGRGGGERPYTPPVANFWLFHCVLVLIFIFVRDLLVCVLELLVLVLGFFSFLHVQVLSTFVQINRVNRLQGSVPETIRQSWDCK